MAPEKESVQLYPSRDQGSHGVHREALFLFSPQPLLTHCHQRSALHVDRLHVAPGKFHLPQTLLCGWLCGRRCPQWTHQDPQPHDGPSAAYLHPTDAHTQAGRGALRALVHVTSLLLLRCVIPVLPGPHLQVQDTGVLVL